MFHFKHFLYRYVNWYCLIVTLLQMWKLLLFNSNTFISCVNCFGLRHVLFTSLTYLVLFSLRLLSKHFCLQLFFLKDSFFVLYGQFSGSVGWLHGRHRSKNFGTLCLPIAGKCIFLVVFLEFYRVLWGVLKKSWIERYMQLSLCMFESIKTNK